VMYFQWRKSRGSSEKFHGAVVDHDNSEKNRVFKEVAQVGRVLEKISEIVGTNRTSETAILYDWESHWALTDAQGFAAKTKQYPQTLHSHYRFFWEKDIPVDVITKEQDFSSYKLLIVPMLYMASEEIILRLKDYVKNGGTLVMTYISAIVNEYDLVYFGGWPEALQEIFGVNPIETDTLYPSDKNAVRFKGKRYVLKDYATILETKGAEAIGVYEEDFYADTPALTRHVFGNGQAFYIGARLEDEFHRHFYSELTHQLLIKPAVNIIHETGVSVQIRRAPDCAYVFVMNFTEKEQTVQFREKAIDLLSGEVLIGELTLEKYGVRILKIRH